jgi:hypothetical protein
MEKLILPSILLVRDVIPLCELILKVTQPLTEFDPKIKDLHQKVSGIYLRLVKNQKYSPKSRLTEELIVLDNRRGRAFVALRDIIHGLSVSLIEEMAFKAAVLYALIDKYGTQLYRLNYKGETAILISLFNDFDLATNHELLTDLQLISYYDSLKTAQKEFERVNEQKSHEKTVYTNESEAALQILEELFPVLTSLVALIQLNNEFEPAKYGSIYHQVVTYITETNQVARARKTRKEKVPVN